MLVRPGIRAAEYRAARQAPGFGEVSLVLRWMDSHQGDAAGAAGRRAWFWLYGNSAAVTACTEYADGSHFTIGGRAGEEGPGDSLDWAEAHSLAPAA